LERLRRAAITLQLASAEQQIAAQALREALGALKEASSGLGETMTRYHVQLGALQETVRSLQARQRQLAAWAAAESIKQTAMFDETV
jgi:hypothetical protein